MSTTKYIFFLAAFFLLTLTTYAQNSKEMENIVTADETHVLSITRQLTRLMIERDTSAMNKILDHDYTLTHMTGYVQPKSEWLAEVAKETMKYYSAKEVAHSVKIEGTHATLVEQNLVDARIWGSRNTWRLQQTYRLEKRDGNWIILNSVATTFR